MSCKLNYKGEYYSEGELRLKFLNDPVMIEKHNSRKNQFDSSNYTLEDVSVFKQKIDFLQKSMDVKVMFDKNVGSSRVLGSEDKRVKDAGKPVVVVNPDRIFTTTAIHEFAHIFLDSFPKGIDNLRLKKAYEMLKGTELEGEVALMYPELSKDGEMFKKELIATAMGRKGAEIWASKEDQSTWAAIKEWIIGYIKRTFKISDSNEVNLLVSEILNSKVKRTGMSKMDQLEKTNEKKSSEKKEDEKKEDDDPDSIRNLERLHKEQLAMVENIYIAYAPETTKQKQKEAVKSMKGKTRFESITELREALSDLDKTDRKLGIKKYIEWVKGEIGAVKGKTKSRKEEGTLSRDSLNKSFEWTKGFDMIDDMQSLVIGLHKDNQITTEEKNKYNKEIGEVQRERAELGAMLLDEMREVFVEFIAENDNSIEFEYKKRIEKDYDELGVKSSGISKEQYVIKELEKNSKEIKEKTRKLAYDTARESVSDINIIKGNILSEKNSTSKEIQIISKITDDLDQAVNHFGIEQAAMFDFDNDRYKKDVSKDFDQSKKYKGLYDSTKNGSTYYAGEYLAEFYEQRRELLDEAFSKKVEDSKYKDVKVDSSTLSYIINGVTRKLKLNKASKYKVAANENGDSFHVSYFIGTERFDIPTSEAIARSELSYWREKNTIFKEDVSGFEQEIPHPDWINKDYKKLSESKKKTLNFLKEKTLLADELYEEKGSLVKKAFGQTFIQLPSILKSDAQRITQGYYSEGIKNKFSEAFKTTKDDYETQTGESGSAKSVLQSQFQKVFTNVANKEKLKVQIPFRARLKKDEQSLDLHSITLMNLMAAKNHQMKSKMESTMLITTEVMKNRKVPDKGGMNQLQKIQGSTEDAIPVYKDKKDILDAKQAMSIIESRFYGIKSKDAGTIEVGTNKDGTKKTVEVNAVVKTWLKYSSWLSLTLNWVNGVVNLAGGTYQNLIEAVGQDNFSIKDWLVANKKYVNDFKQIINDWGSNVDSSRTNLLMQVFNVRGGNTVLDNKFEEGTKAQAWSKMKTLRPIANSGEHMIHGKLMYSILNNIKAMNKKGEFLDTEGNVVKDKKKAASLDEMIELTPNKTTGAVEIVLHPNVEATTQTLVGGREKIISEARSLIRNKVNELQGNHDPDTQAAWQREFYGKLGTAMRKWIEDSYMRRWRGKTNDETFYSQDAKANKEGYHRTAIRFVYGTLKESVMQTNLEIIKNAKENYANLDSFQKANLRKCITELGLIALTFAAYAALDEDEDEITYKYIFRRTLSELTFFMWPPEALKVVSTPTASIGTLRNFMSVIAKTTSPFEVYEQGPHQGRNKLTVALLKSTPIASQFMKDSKSSLDFLNNSSGGF